MGRSFAPIIICNELICAPAGTSTRAWVFEVAQTPTPASINAIAATKLTLRIWVSPLPIPSDFLALAEDRHHDAKGSAARPSQCGPGPAGSHESGLKKLLSVSELALNWEMAATYILGPFRLDAETDTLFRGGEPVALGHRAVALLRLLVEQRGNPVSKDALMEAAWAGLTVEESNLAVQIAALRRVLGEESGGANWIETLPRRGYRFVGPASIREQATVSAGSRGANIPASANPTLPD